MRRWAIATTAVLLALLGASCASHDGAARVAVQQPGAPPASVSQPTVTTVAPPTTEAAPPTTEASAPTQTVVTEPPAPAPATIEVDYQPHDGATATATIDGPNGSHTKSLGSGAAIFGSLPAGGYSVTVTINSPSDNPSIGDAEQVLNGGNLELQPGDHGVVSCDDSGCTAIL